mmetsp:Transcript_7825/g.23642  ORF Transcript_7825/g.23642 Transcript_7825/m.23642 type:complete len:253 (-) Transcript_7825:231-989(-)
MRRSAPVALDWVVVFVSVVLTGLLQKCFAPIEREVDLTSEAFTKPLLPDIVPEFMLLGSSIVISFAVFVACEMPLLKRDRRMFLTVFHQLVLGLLGAMSINVLITEIFKNVAGRPRPYFASVCNSYVEGSKTVCTGHTSLVKEARKSFPSGHTSLAFAVAVFQASTIAGALGLGDVGSSLLTVLISSLPTLGAFWVGITRTIDNHHHWSDVVAGAILGASFGRLCYTVSSSRIIVMKNGEATRLSAAPNYSV